MPPFTANYPFSQSGKPDLLPTPERVGALPDYRGHGVVIAFIDAGFYPHPDFADHIVVHADATTHRIVEQKGSFRQNDLSWHGQMTVFIAAGDGSISGGKYRGIASRAQLVLVKVSNPRGQIKEADILRGLRWVIDTHRRFNVRIVNISVGGDFESHDPKHPLHVAVRRLTEAGVVVVAAAGNKGSPFVVPPASAPEAITVGGVDDHNSLNRSLWTAYPNNYGVAYDDTSKPEITAPARWIASPLLPESPVAREAQWLASLLQARNVAQARRLLREAWMDLGLSESRYDANIHAALQQRIHTHKLIDARHQHVDGTSVAAPIVSAVIAQMLEANPRLTPPQIRAILAATAQPLTGVPRQKQGAGVIDAARAVQAAKTYS